MQAAELFIAYAPRGVGLRCALAYLASARDVYGWFTGPRHDAGIASQFFLLENFYGTRGTRYVAVAHERLHAPWALDEARRHELARMQDAFYGEWLFHRDDPRAAIELQAYGEAEVAAGEVNLRFEKLAKLSTLQPNWTYYSPRFARAALTYLAKRWPLEYPFDEPAPSSA